MNYPRSSLRNPSQGTQERNFGSDIHEFMEGLGRIAQIMYTSIPIVEFMKIAIKYSWKFCEYLGEDVLSMIGALKVSPKPEILLESLWNKQPAWKSMAKFSSVLAFSVILFCLLFNKPDLEDEWKNTPDNPQPAPEIAQPKVAEIKSEEGRPYQQETYDEYSEYPDYQLY